MNISKAEFIPIRQAFPHEAHDFTQWLAQNLDALSERIGIQFTDIQAEKSVGSFNVDIFCKDGAGDNVIIENQLERTDHDHLGKVLTYMVNLEAKTAIWIATEVRPEHQEVVTWLNQFTPVDMQFYFVKLEAIRIGGWVAPWFTVLVAPDEQLSQIGEQKKSDALSNVASLYFEFWSYFLDYTDGKTPFRYKTPAGRFYRDVTGASIKNGLSISYYVTARDGTIGTYLYISVGNRDENRDFFNLLYEHQQQIEKEIGDTLDWRSDDAKACRIFYIHDGLNIKDKSQWEKIADTLIDMMTRFEKALRPYINR